jgi:hypothetical protein
MHQAQPDLFGASGGASRFETACPAHGPENRTAWCPSDKPLFTAGDSASADTVPWAPPVALIPPELFELSPNAYDGAVYAWMSEFPIEGAIRRFCEKALAAAGIAGGSIGTREARFAADRAATDRGDEDVRIVLEAAYKVAHEIDRMRGLLRFSPDEEGIYLARCAPDHFVLPALADHFGPRFGETPWAIIDEKRNLVLERLPDGETRLAVLPAAEPGTGAAFPEAGGPAGRFWEDLWRNYHRSVNNECRQNPLLQRRFMPVRYWKYLPEMGEGE